eukprot:SAG31_NODE_359_length_17032_cov_11.017894_11_plen_211_part_00
MAAFNAAIGSGLPGLFALRLGSDSFELPPLVLLPSQEIRIICGSTTAVRILRGDDGKAITITAGSVLAVTGVVHSLDVQGSIDLGDSGMIVYEGSLGLTPSTLANMVYHTGNGTGTISVAEGADASVLSAAGSRVGTADGVLPRSFTVELAAPIFEGGTTGQLTCDGTNIHTFYTELFAPTVQVRQFHALMREKRCSRSHAEKLICRMTR